MGGKKENGFTLAETIISLGIFMVISISGANLLNSVVTVFERIHTEDELYQSATLAMNMMVSEVERGSEFILKTYTDGTLETLKTDPANSYDTFVYDPANKTLRYRKNNNLAHHIDNIKVIPADSDQDGNLDSATITITTTANTSDTLSDSEVLNNNDISLEPIVITNTVNLYEKDTN